MSIQAVSATARSFGKRHTRFRTIFSSIWQRTTRALWLFRSRLFGQRPITLAAGSHALSMVAKGQIAEYVWRFAFENSERDFVVKKIKPGMRVLNIGANAGLYTIIASKLVGLQGEVHAFEPSSQSFALLKRNVELNKCTNVSVNNLALSNFQGQLSLHSDPLHPDFDGHFFVQRLQDAPLDSSTPLEIVSCTTLDDYWHRACNGELKPVDFIIIDVEGAELSVFEGARQTIEASPTMAMMMECKDHFAETDALLKQYGFSFYRWELESSRLIPQDIQEGNENFVALRGNWENA
jgi:FkbM family methyltransferase